MQSLTSRFPLTLCLALALAAGASRVSADEPAPKRIYRQTVRAVALVTAGQPRGSAWVVDRTNRLLVTNAHVVGNDETLDLIFPAYRDGAVIAEADYYLKEAKRIRARVIDVSPQDDLAILQVESLPADTVALKLAAASPMPGERIHSIGNPSASGALWVYTSGTVRQVYRRKWVGALAGKTYALDTRVIETQSPTNHGDSGGPLVNDKGELIGVTQGGTLTGQLVSWFVDVTPLRRFVTLTQRLLKPASAVDFNDRGDRLAARGRSEAALADFDKALQLDPKLAVAYANRAGILNGRGDHEAAIKDCERALALNSKESRAYLQRAVAFEAKGDAAAAHKNYQQACKLDPRWETLAPLQDSRTLRVVNKTGQALHVYVRYEAKTPDGTWRWFYTDAPLAPLSFTVPPGASANLFDGYWWINARRVRIWAEGAENGGAWLRDRDQDLWLAREPYRARSTDTYTCTFTP